MRHVATTLDSDLSRTASTSYIIAAVELDEGVLYLSDTPGSLGSDSVVSGVYNFTADGFEIETSSIPHQFEHAKWINRRIVLRECVASMKSVSDGVITAERSVSFEPSLYDGILTVVLGLVSRRIVNMPDFGVINKTRYPAAPEDSLGRILPLIFGTISPCPLIPMNALAVSSLAESVFPGNNKLALVDAANFPSYGAVWIDNESIYYSSRTNTELLGCVVASAHTTGTVVAFTGESSFLASGNACLSITQIKGDSTLLEADRFITNSVLFNRTPLIPVKAESFNALLQFDNVASAAFTQVYNISYDKVGVASVDPLAGAVPAPTPSPAPTSTITTPTTVAQPPSTKEVKTTSISYTAISGFRATDFELYGPIFYHSPTGSQMFGSTYADSKLYGRIVFTLTASQVLDIPVGAKASIRINYAESAGDFKYGITITNAYAINGAAVTDNVTIDVVGTVTFTSTITLIVSTSQVHFLSNMTGKMMRVNRGVQLTLEDLMANSSWGPWVGPNFDFRVATAITAEWLQ